MNAPDKLHASANLRDSASHPVYMWSHFCPKIISTEFGGRRCSDFRTKTRDLGNFMGKSLGTCWDLYFFRPQFFWGCGEHRRTTFLFLTSWSTVNQLGLLDHQLVQDIPPIARSPSAIASPRLFGSPTSTVHGSLCCGCALVFRTVRMFSTGMDWFRRSQSLWGIPGIPGLVNIQTTLERSTIL